MAESYLSEYLPEEFIPQQKLLFYYNDLFSDMLMKSDEYNLTLVEFPLNNKDEMPKEGKDIIDWMLASGFEDEAYQFFEAHLFFNLLQDFNFYMHESFSCAERGKISVAYTISRKPIKDTLFYLSWLLVDTKQLMKKILNDDPKEYDVSKLSSDFKLEILNKSVELVESRFAASLLFELIYDRKCEYGLSSIWDQSLHLVTTNRNYPTKKRNLNFVFAYDQMWKDFWKTYYSSISIVLGYAIEVIVKIFESIVKPEEVIIKFNRHLRDIKFINATGTSNSEIVGFTEDLLSVLSVICDECSNEYYLKGKVADEIINEFLYTCPNCGKTERVGEYFNSWEKLNNK